MYRNPRQAEILFVVSEGPMFCQRFLLSFFVFEITKLTRNKSEPFVGTVLCTSDAMSANILPKWRQKGEKRGKMILAAMPFFLQTNIL
jgi:hypothetical protein